MWFLTLLTHLRYPLLLKGPKLWEQSVPNLSQSSHQIVVRYPSPPTFKDSNPHPAHILMITAFLQRKLHIIYPYLKYMYACNPCILYLFWLWVNHVYISDVRPQTKL